MLKSNSGDKLLNHSWNGLSLCIGIAFFIMCFNQIAVNAVSTTTCNSSNCSLREWLVILQEESSSVECTLSQLEKSTALLSKVKFRTTSMRLNQITKLKKTLSNLKGEIEIINSTCSTFYGPDCNQTNPECNNSKCISCASPGQCSVCYGNRDGPTCSTCKTGWNGTDCNIPICGSNCASCSAPNVCPTCKSGWYGSDCNSNTPPLILNSAQITKFTNLIMSNATISSSKRLFKATRDGFSASAFHSKCDNKGPTIVIVRATSGAIFGAYTAVSWTSQNTYVSDNSAYLFSLVSSSNEERFTKLTFQNSNSIYSKISSNNDHAVYYSPYSGPTFGGGNDLYIADYANSNTNSASYLCNTYCDTTMTKGSETALNYLAGSLNFQVEDYEVYSL